MAENSLWGMLGKEALLRPGSRMARRGVRKSFLFQEETGQELKVTTVVL